MRGRAYRSYLYVPAHQAHRVDKAYASAADAVVLDLEDAVPFSHKDAARAAAAELLAQAPPKPTSVRVNSISSGRCRDDVFAVAQPGLSAVRLPKVESPEQIAQVAEWLDEAHCDAEIQLLIESAHALENAYRLATASPRVGLLGLGEGDLRADLRTGVDEATLDATRARCVIASRAAGLDSPPQSVYPEVRDLEGLRLSTMRGKEMGFLGRFAIHPTQIPIIHEVYTPTGEEITRARAVADAADRARKENSNIVITDEGRFVGPPIVANAKLVLQLAENLKIEAHS
jgi:citrate lyase subunit beta / citryl-CoA lyase